MKTTLLLSFPMRTIIITLFSTLLLFACGTSKPNYHSLAHESEPLLRVPSGEPESLDPRLVRSFNGVTALHLIYDGLLRHNYRNQLVPALAKSYEVSDDQKTYTFHLRRAMWSNGDPMTAHDFKETWISQLHPDFPAPNAYQLYVIKGAKAFKEGLGTSDNIGIRAVDDHTLVVELESPVPYFTELAATDFFFAVHKSTRDGSGDPDKPISNGPFVVADWHHHSSLIAQRNEQYWDRPEVKLEEVELAFIDDTTALNMFLAGELHWAGSPNSNLPTDSLTTLSQQDVLHSQSGAATTFFRVNTTRAPLNNVNLRKALSLALDREAIAQHLMQGKQEPANGYVPPIWLSAPGKKDQGNAWEYYQRALQELNIDRDSMPTMTLCYTNNSERNQKIAQAVQQQWKKALGIEVQLEQCESVSYYDKLYQMNYDISLGSWLADFRDPINFLEVFKTKETPTNNTGWENAFFIQKLHASSYEMQPKTRMAILEEAEEILMSEMPIIPIFYNNYLFAKQENVHGISISELGHFDFKYAFIDDADVDELIP